jgi:AcrR family transcriptional regulator
MAKLLGQARQLQEKWERRHVAGEGLRERKRRLTRQRISDIATAMFAARGFDNVTVSEVADIVGVSEKTVYNYFPTKEDLFFDEVPEREAALVAAVTGRRKGESVLQALRRLQTVECPRLCSPGFANFARIIEDSTALKAKELEVMSRFVQVLTEALEAELALDERDARLAAGLLVSVHRQLFRAARKQALAGRHGPAAARRLRADLDRAYHLLEHGLGDLDRPSQGLDALHTA